MYLSKTTHNEKFKNVYAKEKKNETYLCYRKNQFINQIRERD